MEEQGISPAAGYRIRQEKLLLINEINDMLLTYAGLAGARLTEEAQQRLRALGYFP